MRSSAFCTIASSSGFSDLKSFSFGSRYSFCIGRREGHCCPNDKNEVLHDRIISKYKVESVRIHRSHLTVVKVSPGRPSLLKKFA